MTWILKGHVSVASDSTTAGLISSPVTQTRAALISVMNGVIPPLVEDAAEVIVPPLVAQAISDDGSVAAAAAAAVNAALASTLGLAKSAHITAGELIYDPPGSAFGTHYLLPDHTGELVARPTVWPVPAATPVLNW